MGNWKKKFEKCHSQENHTFDFRRKWVYIHIRTVAVKYVYKVR